MANIEQVKVIMAEKVARLLERIEEHCSAPNFRQWYLKWEIRNYRATLRCWGKIVPRDGPGEAATKMYIEALERIHG
jgi:hypothetical protein